MPLHVIEFWKRRSGKPAPSVPDFATLLRTVQHGVSPYHEFPNHSKRKPNKTWGFTHIKEEFIQELFEETTPKFIVEVGSWVGGSAIRMAKVLKRMHLDVPILCIGNYDD